MLADSTPEFSVNDWLATAVPALSYYIVSRLAPVTVELASVTSKDTVIVSPCIILERSPVLMVKDAQ